jgi:predicted TIM-barrel fold metal-dependent hydrolase
VDWFDCHAEFGRRMTPNPIQRATAPELAALLGEIGVGRALVLHPAQYEHHPAVGNARVAEETRGVPGLHPAWALLPPQLEELGDVDAFLAAMREGGARALWAFPDQHRFHLTMTALGPLIEAMAARRIPLLLKTSDASKVNWGSVAAFLAEAPSILRVICVTTALWGEDRYFVPIFQQHRNLHIATSTLNLEGAIPAFVRRFGPDRLLYGSSFPDRQPGGTLLAVLHSGLPDADVAAIAGGNLDRLLREVQP